MNTLIRSWLFVPGDSERKQAKALSCDADALILDLEDSVAPAQLDAARARVQAFLKQQRHNTSEYWVRVNPLMSGKLGEDLDAILQSRPHGVVLPKLSSVDELLQIDEHLSALEGAMQLPPACVRVLVIATETPQSLLNANGYATLGTARRACARLAGLTWGHEDLAAALGAIDKYEADGSLAFTYQLARSFCLLSAASAGVQAVDGVYADFRDAVGLQREAQRARGDGFTGKLAIHPDQVSIINSAFLPTAAQVQQAQRIVAAFNASAGTGVLAFEGRMLDRPHLIQAQRILAAAAAHRGKPS